MPLTRTLEQLREAVQRTADVVAFTEKHPVTAVNDLVNRGLGALSRVCRTVCPEFQPIGSTTITADGVATMFALPSNFRSLISVEYTDEGGNKNWLQPFELSERASLTTPEVVASSTRADYYRIVGGNIEILPRPPEDDTVLLWYATTATQLAADASTVDVMDRLDDYVIWWAAREIAMEREAWERHDRLSQKLMELEGDMRVLARSRDLSAPARITDIYATDRYGRRVAR